jgi:outer membrane lipoprotein LolB
MRILNLSIVILFAFTLAGCAALPPRAPALNQPMSWQKRAAALAKIQNWDIHAVMAVRTSANNEGGSANLQWLQREQDYTILLWGALGADLIKLSGKPGHVLLETANGNKASAATPELLLLKQAGWQFPVSNLYYWIRGLPAPDSAAQKRFDAYHHLSRLEQQGWRVEFLHYTQVAQMDVPDKILLENWQIKVKIIIFQWKI